MAHLDDYVCGNPPRPVVLSHCESRCSNYIKEAFMNSHALLESYAILRGCEVLLKAFYKQLDALYQRFQLDRAKESDEYALSMVIELSNAYLASG